MARRNTMLSQSEAEKRAEAHHDYRLMSVYDGMKGGKKAEFYCPKHRNTFSARVKHVFSGMRLQCCHKEHMSALLSKKMKGKGNNFYGRHHSEETRRKLSEDRLGEKHPMFGKQRSRESVEKTRQALLGRPRSEETKRKLREHNLTLSCDFAHCVNKAATSKTRNKQGVFYIAKIGSLLKFGSATDIGYRMRKLKSEHGEAELLMAATVPDAADYEAVMMTLHRAHWDHGEFFKDFREGLPA